MTSPSENFLKDALDGSVSGPQKHAPQVLVQQIWSFWVITEIPQKSFTIVVSPLKVIGTDTNRSATNDFLLVFYGSL